MAGKCDFCNQPINAASALLWQGRRICIDCFEKERMKRGGGGDTRESGGSGITETFGILQEGDVSQPSTPQGPDLGPPLETEGGESGGAGASGGWDYEDTATTGVQADFEDTETGTSESTDIGGGNDAE